MSSQKSIITQSMRLKAILKEKEAGSQRVLMWYCWAQWKTGASLLELADKNSTLDTVSRQLTQSELAVVGLKARLEDANELAETLQARLSDATGELQLQASRLEAQDKMIEFLERVQAQSGSAVDGPDKI